ncbi:hypothetical protein [Janthinobacterium fluminis]|uniref:UDP:flavonoid glycosyltransferase YjiC, YdhE family n=1 Tax=Janthinobacterium fluminis TaxID=2987524 RepID=A0ABT5JYG8_9BURK|nr:hypothetical protein [Janthinobacterium fluminis]MDC8757091.1 hypothetical protein [Janthinobacterium fluminis]
MSALRLVYLATADARGHLMRAQLLTHALRAAGASVRVLTTSDEGSRFLAGFGVDAGLLSRHYAVQFDARQNMLREATDANVANYLFRPSRMLRDIWRLRAELRGADLVINDSFHPALLFMGCVPGWRRKVVHVYGASLRHALETNFHARVPGWLARLFGRIVALQIGASRARLEHDFGYAGCAERAGSHYRLPTPVALVSARNAAPSAGAAAVYLNPHFRDPQLAEALESGLAGAGERPHLVGEGYAGRAGWQANDPDWIDRAVASAFIVSAPGMAALSIAQVYSKPILLVVSEQPEQQINAARAAELGLLHRTVTWRGDAAAFADAVRTAGEELRAAAACAPTPGGHAAAAARLQTWVGVLTALAPRR